MASVTTVEMGETAAERAVGVRLQACGLGACVGLCLYETAAQIAVLVHVVLPLTLPPAAGRPPVTPLPGKCADTALLHGLAELTRRGGATTFVRAALVGGAQIFTPVHAGGGEVRLSRLEIGQRNVLALKDELRRAGIPLCAEQTGGHGGRTVTLESGTGDVWVRPVGLPERLLVSLGRRAAPDVSAFSLPPSAMPAPAAPMLEGAGAYGN